MLRPKQNRATLISLSVWRSFVSNTEFSNYRRTHGGEVVKNISLCFIREDRKTRNPHGQACRQRYCSRHMRNSCESIQRRRAQAPIDEEWIMVTDERETDNPNGLKDTRLDDGVAFGRITFKKWWHQRPFEDDWRYDYEHAAEGKGRCDGKFVDVAIQWKRIRYAWYAKYDDKLTICEHRENGYRRQRGEYGTNNMRNCIPCSTVNWARHRSQ